MKVSLLHNDTNNQVFSKRLCFPTPSLSSLPAKPPACSGWWRARPCAMQGINTSSGHRWIWDLVTKLNPQLPPCLTQPLHDSPLQTSSLPSHLSSFTAMTGRVVSLEDQWIKTQTGKAKTGHSQALLLSWEQGWFLLGDPVLLHTDLLHAQPQPVGCKWSKGCLCIGKWNNIWIWLRDHSWRLVWSQELFQGDGVKLTCSWARISQQITSQLVVCLSGHCEARGIKCFPGNWHSDVAIWLQEVSSSLHGDLLTPMLTLKGTWAGTGPGAGRENGVGLQERTAGAACEGRGKCSALKVLRTERFHCAEKKKMWKNIVRKEVLGEERRDQWCMEGDGQSRGEGQVKGGRWWGKRRMMQINGEVKENAYACGRWAQMTERRKTSTVLSLLQWEDMTVKSSALGISAEPPLFLWEIPILCSCHQMAQCWKTPSA